MGRRVHLCLTRDKASQSIHTWADGCTVYIRLRGHSHRPLFCTFEGSPISTRYFNSELRRCLIFCGLSTSHYKSHSFRIGATCLAAEQGYSDAQIRALGRWHSNAFKVYITPVALHANSTLALFSRY